ncbi:hypothetical protein ABKV19_005600 [Rosa sericea]
MPEMKLGTYDRLRSWQESQNSPGPGPFTLNWDSDTRQLEVRRDGHLWWTSEEFGTFDFINIPVESKVSYSFIMVPNENRNSFSYNYSAVGDQNVRSVWVLHTDGGCHRWGRQATSYCPYTDFKLRKNGSFKPISMDMSVNSTWLDTNQSRYGSDHCKATCWMDCDCLGFDFLYDNQTGCRFWSVKNSQFLEDPDSSATKYIISGLITRKLSRRNNDASHKWIWIGFAIVAALLEMVLCSICYEEENLQVYNQNQTRIQEMLNMMNSNRRTNANGLQNDEKGGHDLSVFNYTTIITATCNFSDQNKLGEGGFGPGKLVTGQEIAVNRLSKCSGQGKSEFKNELILIYELQHTNLVQLFGFCIHGEERMFIYEYMANKSLDYFLFDSTRCQQLDWNKRFSIIEGVAQGLLYLHKYSRKRVIHRDLKASNVLLDENMNPKFFYFGMARIFTNDEQEANTMKIVGTRFGVLILEILSGRKNNSFYNDDHAVNIVGYAWALWREGVGLRLMDPRLGDSCDKNQFLRCINVGMLCVEENAANRPTMLDVISMLGNESISLPVPTKPAFCTERNVITVAVGGNGQEIVASVNGISNSDFDGR